MPTPHNLVAGSATAREADGTRVWWGLEVLIAAAAAIFVVGLALGLIFVGRHGGGAIQGWDNRVQTWHLTHRFGLVGVAKVIAYVGDAPKLAVVAIVLSAGMLVVFRSLRGLVPLVAYLGGEFQVYVIRAIIHRPRPATAIYPAPGAIPGTHETSYSYPSGHAVGVTSIFFALAGIAALTHRVWWPWLLALLGSVFVIETRLLLGVHWFSDVTFGWLLGAAWGVAVAVVALRVEWTDIQAWMPRRSRRSPG